MCTVEARLGRRDRIQGHSAYGKAAADSVGLQTRVYGMWQGRDRFLLCGARADNVHPLVSLKVIGIVSLLHCHHFRCIACAENGDDLIRKLHRDWGM
jgi:hypothetical protein